MLKKIGIAAALALSLGIVPMAGHADVSNGCLAHNDNMDGSSIYVGAYQAPLTCTYTATTAAGQVIQSTPNHVDVTFEWLNPVTGVVETVNLYHQGTTVPGTGGWNDARTVGQVITVTVGPDGGLGSIGTVWAGDAS